MESTPLSATSLRRQAPAPGSLAWIGIRPQRRRPICVVPSVEARPTHGLVGDHYSGSGGLREVTLFQMEHLDVMSAFLGRPIEPQMLRRNLGIRGMNLLALKEMQVQIGTAVLEITGSCPPCSRMEENLGPGGYQAVRGHGGVTARVVRAGQMQQGDPVRVVT